MFYILKNVYSSDTRTTIIIATSNFIMMGVYGKFDSLKLNYFILLSVKSTQYVRNLVNNFPVLSILLYQTFYELWYWKQTLTP